MFTGPQKYHQWGSPTKALYVGTTYTTHGDYRGIVPAVSSRSLYNLHIAEKGVRYQSLAEIDIKYRDHFLVDYVYGFSSASHAYFVTVQKKSHNHRDTEKGYVTRLARVCVTDKNFDTYTEVTLECNGANRKQVIR